MSDKNWIQKAIKKPGSLRKSLGVKKGKKIPAKKLNAAAESRGQLAVINSALHNLQEKAVGVSQLVEEFKGKQSFGLDYLCGQWQPRQAKNRRHAQRVPL